MKILLVVQDLNKTAGVSRYVFELAQRFKEEHEVHILASFFDCKIDGVRFHEKKIIRHPFWLRVLSNCIQNERYIRKLKKKHGFDIIHTQTGSSLTGDIATAHSCHRAAIKELNIIDKKERPFLECFLRIEKRIIKDSKRIITVSKGVKDEILENYNVLPGKIIPIPSGVDLGAFRPDTKTKEGIRRKYGILKDETLLLFCGYEFSRKGLKYIIKALPHVKGKVKLFVVGKDDPKLYRVLAEKLGVLAKVIFTGFVPRIEDYYIASDIFVFPTVYEPFGLVIAEAMAAGIPVIAPKLAGACDIIEDGHSGLLLDDPADFNDIAGKINLLIKNKDLREIIGINARKEAGRYAWDKIAEDTLRVYKEIIT